VAGFKTVQILAPYDRAVIIDSICDGSRAGHVRRLLEEELGAGSSFISHGVNLRSALDLARRLSFPVPREVLIYVIAVQDPYTFGEQFTPEVEKALPAAARTIASQLARGAAATFRSPGEGAPTRTAGATIT